MSIDGLFYLSFDAPRDALRAASTPVRFTIEAIGADDIRATEETRFLGPVDRGDS